MAAVWNNKTNWLVSRETAPRHHCRTGGETVESDDMMGMEAEKTTLLTGLSFLNKNLNVPGS